VQVTATTNAADAESLTNRLKAKGYDAYSVRAPMRGRTWYRVRVGRFESRQRAADVERELKVREGLVNAYVTAR
jgi:cell division septation protein DedD